MTLKLTPKQVTRLEKNLGANPLHAPSVSQLMVEFQYIIEKKLNRRLTAEEAKQLHRDSFVYAKTILRWIKKGQTS